MRSRLVRHPIDLPAMIAQVADPACGAVSVFLGRVRDVHNDKAVTGIEYSAYEPMAAREMDKILVEVGDRFSIRHIVLEHRLGRLEVGDVSVAIVVAHPHRQPAMDATRQVIEELKKKVPIWKLEHYADGTREWVDPTRGAPSIPPTSPVAEVVG